MNRHSTGMNKQLKKIQNYIKVSTNSKVDIKKGVRICDYYGKIMSWAKKKQLYGDETNYIYQMRRVGKAIVAREHPYLTNNITNYINEGRIVNVELKLRGLYSKEDIKKGEELYLQYPKLYKRYWLKKSK